LLRETFAHCHLEILGYQHIASLAVEGGASADTTYADAVRNIEAGPLASFFARNGDLSPDWCEYFASFNQVVSWLFDPDGIFEANIKRAGVKNYLPAYAKITDEAHASAQLARGLERMALYLDESAARLIPGEESRRAAAEWLAASIGSLPPAIAAFHPGSGSPRKNWPLDRWHSLARQLVAQGRKLLLIGGEADAPALEVLAPLASATARGLALPTLAALLAQTSGYFGHDTGISHLAAAVGVPCTLLFGPTDPAVWAPQGSNVRVIAAPDGDLAGIAVEEVLA
jgi:heptosyltransferase III